MNVQEKKQELRDQFLSERKALSEQDYRDKSELIINTLLEQPEYREALVIHCYVAMEERREVNTQPFIQEMLKHEKQVALPVVDFGTGRIKSFFIESLSELEKNKWGVLEPEKGVPAQPENIDLVIVPMVGGDKERNRIGYGKGFYDRFLSSVTCPKIGLLFDRCLVDSIPTETFDVPLSKVITEQRVIS